MSKPEQTPLRYSGALVTAVRSASEALALVRKVTPDIEVLTLDRLRESKTNARGPASPAAALTLSGEGGLLSRPWRHP